MLDPKADAFFLDADIENLGLHRLAFLILGGGFFARTAPRDVGQMDQTVHTVLEANKQPEFCDAFDFALDEGANCVARGERFPWIVHGLLEAQADPAFGGVNVEDDDFNLLAGRYDLARMYVFLRPAHLGDMDKAFNARLKFNERAVVSDIGDSAREFGADRELELDTVPRIGFELLHSKRNPLALRVHFDDLNFDGLANVQHLRWVRDATPRHVGDMQEAIDTTEVDERAVVSDVFDHALEDLTL